MAADASTSPVDRPVPSAQPATGRVRDLSPADLGPAPKVPLNDNRFSEPGPVGEAFKADVYDPSTKLTERQAGAARELANHGLLVHARADGPELLLRRDGDDPGTRAYLHVTERTARPEALERLIRNGEQPGDVAIDARQMGLTAGEATEQFNHAAKSAADRSEPMPGSVYFILDGRTPETPPVVFRYDTPANVSGPQVPDTLGTRLERAVP
jgi:hypothetical protein